MYTAHTKLAGPCSWWRGEIPFLRVLLATAPLLLCYLMVSLPTRQSRVPSPLTSSYRSCFGYLVRYTSLLFFFSSPFCFPPYYHRSCFLFFLPCCTRYGEGLGRMGSFLLILFLNFYFLRFISLFSALNQALLAKDCPADDGSERNLPQKIDKVIR